MDINLLVKMTSRAWSLQILALLHRGTPGRQATLLAETGAGRTAFAQSLRHLIEIGLVERNPGHGHPLRPEFRLTSAGIIAAAAAHRILKNSPKSEARDLLRKSWTVPILAISTQPRQFSQLKSGLRTITDRALSQSLKALQSNDWLSRSVDPAAYPPRPTYRAVGIGAQIGAAARPETMQEGRI